MWFNSNMMKANPKGGGGGGCNDNVLVCNVAKTLKLRKLVPDPHTMEI